MSVPALPGIGTGGGGTFQHTADASLPVGEERYLTP